MMALLSTLRTGCRRLKNSPQERVLRPCRITSYANPQMMCALRKRVSPPYCVYTLNTEISIGGDLAKAVPHRHALREWLLSPDAGYNLCGSGPSAYSFGMRPLRYSINVTLDWRAQWVERMDP